MDASVVVATFNRALLLRRTLESVLSQDVSPTLEWEIVVGDNNSADDTRAVVAELAAVADVPIRYVVERRPGVSAVRNAGVSASSGTIVAFLDDDVMADKGWLAAVLGEFAEDPCLGVLTGRVVHTSDARLRVAITSGTEPRVLQRHALAGLVLGCNLACRREVLTAIHLFDPRLGAGSGLAGDDIDLVVRALRAGFKGRFSPTPLVYHDPAPRPRRYLRGWGAMYLKHLLHGDWEFGRAAWWEVRRIGGQLAKADLRGRAGAVRDFKEIGVGAVIMAGRMLASAVGGLRRRWI